MVTLLELLRVILDVARNNANADGHREIRLIILTNKVFKPQSI